MVNSLTYIYNDDNNIKDPRTDFKVLRDYTDSYQSFKIRITTLSEKTKMFDVKFLVCGTQKIQSTDLYIENSEEWLNETQRTIKYTLIPGIGSSDFPEET